MSGNIRSSVMGGQGTASGKPGFPEAAAAISANPVPTDLSGPQSSPAATPRARNLLLHVCCGPCAVMPITRLLDEGFAVTAWYMNPNIHPLSEYLRRRDAAGECAERMGIPILYDDASWNVTTWLRAVAGRDVAPQRCAYCCSSRIEAAFAAASQLGFAFVSSSLLYSRYQPHDVIRQTGERLSSPDGVGPDFVYRDFREDWQEGIDRSKSMELYRQPYCGCIYSEAERYEKKLARLILAR
ncbi:MAG: epoxyqueuosine reductase QueH [Desulfovibrio sp.]|uniref:epoxyqueuosine reductase QueH n=1 Tax=Desulfovibrio sp. TaxID=885 RepID=UPI002A36E7CA|nr:epoxyqueuosine reductase QueH [Desulfovibrio sp.]MDY0258900.1 epoxyqueuosine reductase QueH [Desulfovibrio sp.]